MDKENKILGENRRALILEWLESKNGPITGSDLAARTNVSRQVIVQDISLLKAKGHPLIATSQGYLYLHKDEKKKALRVIAVQHGNEETEDELNIIVDHGIKVRDVSVEHPVYGELTAPLMLNSRRDVQQFIKQLKKTNASLLSKLTNGIHLHTIEGSNEEDLNEVCYALKTAGYLLDASGSDNVHF